MKVKVRSIIGPVIMLGMITAAVAIGKTFKGPEGVAFGILFFFAEVGVLLIVVDTVTSPSPAQKVAHFIGRWEVLRVESEGGQALVLVQGTNGNRQQFAASYDTHLGRTAGTLIPGDRIEIQPREPGEYEYHGYLENYLKLLPA